MWPLVPYEMPFLSPYVAVDKKNDMRITGLAINLLVLNVGNGWEWRNGIIIKAYCGSFPHSLLSTSKSTTAQPFAGQGYPEHHFVGGFHAQSFEGSAGSWALLHGPSLAEKNAFK